MVERGAGQSADVRLRPDASPEDAEAPGAGVARPLADIHPRAPTPHEGRRGGFRPSNLTLRVMTAAVLLPPVLYVCEVGGPLFVAVISGFVLLAIQEFYDLIVEKGANPHRLLGSVAAAVIPLIFWLGDTFLATSFLTALLLTTMVLQLTKRELREAIASVSATFFGVFYVGWLLSHAVSVRFIYHDLVRRYGDIAIVEVDPEVGFFYIVLCLCGALGCDIGAYFVGRRYGRRRLAPEISPNKTVEGAIGGVLTGGVVGLGVKLFFDSFWPAPIARDFSFVTAALFGMVIAAVGILGDLVESVLKRDAHVKDAGYVLPGVGGVLDRIDSVLLAFPVMYYMLLAYYYIRY